MSSMRNAVQRRNHKERAQPLERQKWGILEKHKDYSLRAKDHNEKRRRLKVLKEKATFRNPDEFHFGMMSAKTIDGMKVGDRGNKALSQNVVKLLKTQDAGYIRTTLQKTRKEKERLEQEIQIADGKVKALKEESGKGGKLTTFVESREEQMAFAPPEMDDDDDSDAWSDEEEEEEKTVKSASKPQETKEEIILRRKRARAQEARRSLLATVKEREHDLTIADNELEMQRAKMNNDIGGVNKAGVKFKIRARKR
ncbi:u3 small nucleolar rna-associated protein utp11 [Venturia nashicola]|uniref:U3 small nucleolar RNA-associated protein 11 n=1 Tax=Venturia nashicola TaxID=86259 RepID=A0A4Z1PKS2_9PEZI|nr:u3 small nucleolar rna-associated protein utp11 [Venturia nashicola]TLD38400.1 u3 small nucleolar rna-associated protein utp11 [Venturia nashicola]